MGPDRGDLLVLNADEIVTCSGFSARRGKEMSDLRIVAGGAVAIRDGIIRQVGETGAVLREARKIFKGASDPPVIDARGKAVLPGFVDSHTHFVFGGYRAEEFSWRLRGDSYMDILNRGGGILSTVRETRGAGRAELAESGKKRLDSFLSLGVTTVEGKSGYGLDLATEIAQLETMDDLDRGHPVDVVKTFMGAHAVPPEYAGRGDDYIAFMMEAVLPEIAARKLAEFCDVFCEAGVFSVAQSRRLLIRAKAAGLKLKLHADEIVRLGGAELAAELGAVSADHILNASDAGIGAMARAGVVATLLPGTAFSLKAPYARGREMIDRGCAVALATDFNPGSCFSESIPLVFALATLYMGMSPEEAVVAFTLNGAAAVGRAGSVGSIDPGKKGDLVILEYPSYRFIPYHIGVSAVEKVIKNGIPVFDRERGTLITG